MTDIEQPSNSALNVKLDYIQRDINEIKADVKDIKKEYVSRMEFNEAMKSMREEIAPLKKFVYAIISILGVAVIGALLNMVLK